MKINFYASQWAHHVGHLSRLKSQWIFHLQPHPPPDLDLGRSTRGSDAFAWCLGGGAEARIEYAFSPYYRFPPQRRDRSEFGPLIKAHTTRQAHILIRVCTASRGRTLCNNIVVPGVAPRTGRRKVADVDGPGGKET